MNNPARFVVLAALDETPSAALVASTAAALTRAIAGGELHLLYVARVERSEFRELTSMDEHREYLEWRAMEARRETQGGPVLVHLREGDPVASILQTASSLDADLVVVGEDHGASWKRWTSGSVCDRVTARAPCPALVVRPKDHHALHAPDIDPPCPDCSDVQRESGGRSLWCARHAEHHPHAHLHYEGSESDALPPDPARLL